MTPLPIPRLARLFLGALLVGSLAEAVPGGQRSSSTLHETAPLTRPAPSDAPRVRPLGIERSALAAGGRQNLEIELFDGRRTTVRLERSEASVTGGRTWSGRLDCDPAGHAAFALHGSAVAGTVREGGVLYRVRSTADGSLTLEVCDGSAFGGCEVDEVPVLPRESSNAGETTLPSASFAAPEPLGLGGLSTPSPVQIVDILVAWTQQAEDAAGGSDEIQALIDLAVMETNQVYANSAVDLNLRLVHGSRIDYLESGNQATDLACLQNPGDGQMDEIHYWRDAFGADAVALFIANADKCGRSYNMVAPASAGFAPYAFQLVAQGCAVGNYTLAHELGHTFGLDHDRLNAGSVPTHPYAYGFWTANGLYRTVMALPRWGVTGIRLPYFSNPQLKYGNQELGIAWPSSFASDCSQALRDNAPVFSAWRPTSVVPTLVKPACTVGQMLVTSSQAPLNQEVEVVISDPDDDIPPGAIPVVVFSGLPANASCGAFPSLDDMLVSIVLYQVGSPWVPDTTAVQSVFLPNVPTLLGLTLNVQPLYFDRPNGRILAGNSRPVTVVP